MANARSFSTIASPSGLRVSARHGGWALVGAIAQAESSSMRAMAARGPGGMGWLAPSTEALEGALVETLPGSTRRLIRRLLPGPAIFVGAAGGELVRGAGPGFAAIHGIGELSGCAAEIVDATGRLAGDGAAVRTALSEVGADLNASERIDEPLSRTPATIIEVPVKLEGRGAAFRVVRPGGYEERFIAKQLAINVLFVCTGNTCRSPMAEAIANSLSKSGDEANRAVQLRVVSAGTGAGIGSPATPEAIEAVRGMGLGSGLSAHRARPLTARLIAEADTIFTMSRSHLASVLELAPDAEDRAQTLDPDGGDVPDPIGMPQEVYDRTARRIMEMIQRRFKELGT